MKPYRIGIIVVMLTIIVPSVRCLAQLNRDCAELKTESGAPLYTAQDAVDQFGGKWESDPQHNTWRVCNISVQGGCAKDNMNLSLCGKIGIAYIVPGGLDDYILKFGKGERKDQNVKVHAVNDVGDQAFFVEVVPPGLKNEAYRSLSFTLVKNNRNITVLCNEAGAQECSEDKFMKIGKFIAERLH